MDCTVHGILQARILEWIAIPFSKESSQPRDRTQVSHIADGFFTIWATNAIAFSIIKLMSFYLRCQIENATFPPSPLEKKNVIIK